MDDSNSCIACYDELTNILYYCEDYHKNWKRSQYCINCINYLKKMQWDNFQKDINDDCLATLRRIIETGPPINVRDIYSMKCENESGEVYLFMYENIEVDAKLENSLIGDERDLLWLELKNKYKIFKKILDSSTSDSENTI